MITAIRHSIQTMRDDWRPYLVLNLFFYGLVVAAVFFAGGHPDVQRAVAGRIKELVTKGNFAPITRIYYAERNIPLAALVTYLTMFLAGAVLQLSLPSLIVPFAGLLILMYRCILWGLLFGPDKILTYPAAGTLLLEGQGYILVAWGIYLHGTRFLRPSRFGFQSHKEGYKAGLSICVRLYALVAIVLFVAALYEAIAGITAR